MSAERPIGVFDSGVGGLSVLRELRRELPQEDLLYVADSAYAPYGERPREIIEARSIAIAEFLLERDAKALVVACNTATGVAVRLLRERYAVPVIAMEPAVKPAVSHSRTGVVGVLATRQTLASDKFSRLLQAHGEAEVLTQACPGLVERVEAGDLEGEETRALLAGYLQPLLARGADTLVLGCTHYPHLAPLIADLAGPEVRVLDSGAAVARQVRRRLAEIRLLAPAHRSGRECFWTSGRPDRLRRVMERLWGGTVELLAMEEAAAVGPQGDAD